MKARQQYNALLKSGALLDIYEDLTGLWEEDKIAFLEIYETEQSIINDIEVDYDEQE